MNRHLFEKYITDYCEDLTNKVNNYPHKHSKHACVLTYNNVIISQGININLKNQFTKNYNELKCLHAEAVSIMRAIRKHYNIIKKCELWVCRNNKLSKSSRPCQMCMKIIRAFGISIIHYTDSSGNWKTEYLVLDDK